MNDLLTQLYSLVADALRGMGPGLLRSLVLLSIILVLLVINFFVMKRTAARRGINVHTQWNFGGPQPSVQPKIAEASVGDPFGRTRATLVGIYKGVLIAVGTVLFAAAAYAAMKATAANALPMLALLLLCSALGVFWQAWRYDRWSRDTSVEDVVDAFRPEISTISVEPKVGYLDNQAIARAQELMRQGAPLDTICREVNPEYGRWDSVQQQAFRTVMESVLKRYHAGT